MNLILEKTDQVPFFTDLESVFDALKIPCQDYDWYLSDLDTNHYPEGFSPKDRWMSGEELKRLISGRDFQFNWGVFSAVPKGFRSEIAGAPFADGNSAYWNDPNYHPQLKCALFEINVLGQRRYHSCRNHLRGCDEFCTSVSRCQTLSAS